MRLSFPILMSCRVSKLVDTANREWAPAPCFVKLLTRTREEVELTMMHTKRNRLGDCVAMMLILSWQLGIGPDALSAARGQPPGMTRQIDVWIDSVPVVAVDQENDPLFGVVGAVFRGDTLIVAERSTGTLRYYDRTTGKQHRTVGGRGEGPGEHLLMVLMQSLDDRIYTYDAVASRVTVFGLSGDVERTLRIEPWGASTTAPQVVGFFPDGSMLATSMVRDWSERIEEPTVRRDIWTISRHDGAGNFVDSLGAYYGKEVYVEPYGRGGERMPEWQVPFARESMVGVLGREYYLVDNMTSPVAVYNQEGRLHRELRPRSNPEPRRVSREDARRFRDADEVDRELPEFYPYYLAARYVAEALWILDYAVHDDFYSWSVFGTDGSEVGRVRSHERLLVLDIDGDIAAVLRVDELGVEAVELRRIPGWR